MKETQVTKRADLFAAFGIGITLSLLALTLILSEQASEAARKGIVLCGRTLLPAVFPFLVLNGMLLRLGFPEWIGRKIGKPLGWLFGIHPDCVAAILVGLCSGFPAGAAVAHRICQREPGLDRDRRRTVLLSSLAAPGFLIAGVGEGMFHDPYLGLLLYLFQIVAAFSIGLFDVLLFGRPPSSVPLTSPTLGERRLFSALAASLKESADAMVGICGAVIFFSALSGMLGLLPLSAPLLCLGVCLLEITAGTSLAATLLPFPQAFVLVAAAIGWSGISVHAQTVMVTEGELKVAPYLLSKCLMACLTAILASAALLLGIV